jgi:hypothetical protein
MELFLGKSPNLNFDYQLSVLSSFFRRYFYDGEKIKGFSLLFVQKREMYFCLGLKQALQVWLL